MKYRIITAYPDKYKIQQSRIGIIWKCALFKNNIEYKFDTLEEAIEDLSKLEKSGKVVDIGE